jgi:hypothetical protein
MLCITVLYESINISEERVTSIFKVEVATLEMKATGSS